MVSQLMRERERQVGIEVSDFISESQGQQRLKETAAF